MTTSLLWLVIAFQPPQAPPVAPPVDVPSFESHEHTERWHQDRIATAWRDAGFECESEVHTADNARCDLVTDDTAWEIDWAPKWAESVGQSVYYGKALHKKPGVLLLVGDDDAAFIERAKVATKTTGVRLVLVPVDGEVPLPNAKTFGAGLCPCGCDKPACKCDGDCQGKAALPAESVSKAKGETLSRRLLLFTATWCGPCKGNHAALVALPGEQVSVGYGGKDAVQVIDIDANRGLAQRWRITAVPTYIVVENEREVSRYVGGSHGVDWFKSVLQPTGPSVGVPAGTGRKTLPVSAGLSHAGQHSHQCATCKTTWWHSSSQAAANPRSHNCPNCGRSQYVVHSWGR